MVKLQILLDRWCTAIEISQHHRRSHRYWFLNPNNALGNHTPPARRPLVHHDYRAGLF